MGRRPHVVIAGAGFAGVRAARKLSRHADLNVTLISSSDAFAYFPQLYHSATGGARTEASLPLAQLLAGCPVKLTVDTIIGFDPEHKAVTSAHASYPYDYLLLALGSVTDYFGIAGLPEFSYDIKTISGAEKFKTHLHRELIEQRKPDLNYVVVGGGPTGVELAAALGPYLHSVTRRHGLVKPKYSIELVEAAPRILPHSPEATSRRVERQLKRLGVKVITAQTVEAETATKLLLSGQSIASKTVAWTAGVANNPFFKANADLFSLAKHGKIAVDNHLQSHPGVYVLGDNAATPFSGMAQTALHDADFAVADLLRCVRQRPRRPYRVVKPITVVPAGPNWAAAEWGPLQIFGYPGFILRRLADLVGYADVESWPQAVRVWLDDARREDNCPICQPNLARIPA